MADQADLVTLGDEADKMDRFEFMVPEDWRPWMRSAARHKGLGSVSAYIRFLINNDLDRLYGPGWKQDHPGGDQG